MEHEVQIITPPTAETPLDDMLVEITRAISQKDPDRVAHGFLGGEFGYGAAYENDVFVMRPYYWGDCDCGYEERADKFWSKNKHSEDCYTSELRREEKAAGIHHTQESKMSYEAKEKIRRKIYKALCKKHNRTYPAGCAVHCTCGIDEKAKAYFEVNGHKPTCALELPNFLHRASGLEVRWYKWIGRSMEAKNLPVSLSAIFKECLDSINSSNNPSPIVKSDDKDCKV